MRTRVRRTKSVAADASHSVTRFDTDAAGDFEGLPHVLSVDAVKAADLPPLGASGMPASLEAHVPVEFRFWKATDLDAARSTRDALVDAAIIATDRIAKVDGTHRLLVTRSFIAPTYEEKSESALVARTSSLMHAASTLALKADDAVAAMQIEASELIELDPKASWIVELTDTPEVQKAILFKVAETPGARAFHIATRPGSLFVTNVVGKSSAPHVVPFETSIAKRDVRLLKAEADGAEERFVLGVVLEPDVVDSQSDTYDAATIRVAAHLFMEQYAAMGLQHTEIVTGKIKILETYIAPSDMTIGDQTVKAGTWLMGLRFVDDALWDDVKTGKLTGLSIGGSAIREPEAPGMLASE